MVAASALVGGTSLLLLPESGGVRGGVMVRGVLRDGGVGEGPSLMRRALRRGVGGYDGVGGLSAAVASTPTGALAVRRGRGPLRTA